MMETADGAIAQRSVWRWLGWSAAGMVLLVPAVAMRFTQEVQWTPGDFLFAAVLVGAVGAAIELAARASTAFTFRAGVALACLASFLTVWITAAVGIVGDEDNPANLLFLALPALALTGAAVVRFRPAGLARVSWVVAATQALVAIVVVGARFGESGPIWPRDVIGISAFLAALWLLAGWQFRMAARR